MTAAAYKYNLNPHQTLYVGGQGMTTLVTVQSHSPGQQQQSGQQFATGKWTAVPLLYRLGTGVVVIIATLTDTYYLQVHGTQTQIRTGPLPPELNAQIDLSAPLPFEPTDSMPNSAMPPMEPMKPMEPMQMSMNPMSMSLGNMSMTMGDAATTTSTTASTSSVSTSAQSAASSEAAAADKESQQESQQTSRQESPAQETQNKVKRFCPQCGSGGIQPGDRFCAYCGKSL